MELRRQDKGILISNSLGYNQSSNNKVDSSSNMIISAFEERKQDDYNHNHNHNQQNLNSHSSPLFHRNQLNLQNQPLKPTRKPPDPTPAPVASRSAASESPPPPIRVVRYRECLKNHAASKGGLVVDGCGEFMPTGEEGTPEELRCAACDCHRNFHRKEIDGEQESVVQKQQLVTTTSQPLIHYHQHQQQNQNSRYPPPPPHGLSFGACSAPTIAMTFGGCGGGVPAESSSEDLNMFHSKMQGYESMQPSSKKRFRTKFSQEQKEKMMEFAEKIDWRIKKEDEQQVQQFCSKVGVKRKVFKVWMHNNKQAMKKKQM